MRSRIELWSGRAGSLALIAGVLLSGTSAFAQQLRNELLRTIVLVDNEGQPSEHYWIGVACGELTDALKTQLELTEGQGVLVDDVMPDSPAAQAGLKKYDVIVAAGDKSLTNAQGLVEAVAQAKEGELNLHIVRGAKKLSIAVKPAKRPAQPAEPTVVEIPANADAEKLQELIQQYMKQQHGAGMRMRMLQPGMVLPPGAPVMAGVPAGATLPDDLTISITRHGNEPAKISVKQGEKSWELIEDKGPTGPGQERPKHGGMESLPPDVRVHVDRMLGRLPHPMFARIGAAGGVAGRAPVRVEVRDQYEAFPAPGQPIRGLVPAPGQPIPEQPRITKRQPEGAGVDQRLEELSRQVRELREAIEKLQKATEGSQK